MQLFISERRRGLCISLQDIKTSVLTSFQSEVKANGTGQHPQRAAAKRGRRVYSRDGFAKGFLERARRGWKLGRN